MSPAELFSLPFMQRALLAALFTGLAAPAVGTYLVQRRLALMGDGIGHVAVTGVAIGLLTGWSPTWTGSTKPGDQHPFLKQPSEGVPR